MASPVFSKLIVPRLLGVSVLAVAGLAWTHPTKAKAAWGLARKCICGASCLLPTREEMASAGVGVGTPFWGADPAGVFSRAMLGGGAAE